MDESSINFKAVDLYGIWDDFLYNLNCYDNKTISKEDFKQIMEDCMFKKTFNQYKKITKN